MKTQDPFARSKRKMESGFAPLSRFIPCPVNPRFHPPAEIEFLTHLLKTYGPDQPIVVDEGWMILKGHGRHMCAPKAGLEEFPYVQRFDLTEAEKIAMRIEDNQVALLATWNIPLVKNQSIELKALGYDILKLGFPEVQLRQMGVIVGTDGGDPEAAPTPPTKPISKRGDVWLLGEHRLLCGDCTSESDVAMCIGDAKPNLMATDPPYGVKYDPTWRADRGVNKNRDKLGIVQNDDRADWSDAFNLFPGDVAYAWSADLRSKQAIEGLEKAGFVPVAQIIWVKDRFALGRGDYHFQHEPCWYAVRKGKKHNWNGGRSQTTTWSIPARDDSGHGHGTQKPVECMKRPIENNSKAGEFVYEPFSGSGTTIIAAEMTKRRCLAIEIDPAYVDVGVGRWEKFTGQKATLESTGQSFEDVGRERAKKKRGGRTRPSPTRQIVSA